MIEFSSMILQKEYYLSQKILLGNFELIAFSARSPQKTTELNEDAIGIFQLENNSLVLAIADGAGGHPYGYKASHIALEGVNTALNRAPAKEWNLRNIALDGMELANKNIMESNLGCRTTLTLCTLEQSTVRIYQVGDSGALLVGQKGVLRFKTLFQSPVGYGLEAGLIQEHEVLDHPNLNQVSNLMGEGEMHIHIGPEIKMKIKDSLLLASDGIFDNYNSEQLIDTIRIGKLEEVVANLLKIFQEEPDKNLKKYDDYSFVICRLAS